MTHQVQKICSQKHKNTTICALTKVKGKYASKYICLPLVFWLWSQLSRRFCKLETLLHLFQRLVLICFISLFLSHLVTGYLRKCVVYSGATVFKPFLFSQSLLVVRLYCITLVTNDPSSHIYLHMRLSCKI